MSGPVHNNEVADCPHCDPQSFAFAHPLQETAGFHVVCGVHPLTEGHILIIPKRHLSCAGAYPAELRDEFQRIYEAVRRFLLGAYGAVSTFEHGWLGQTVFRSHVHLLPFASMQEQVVPEGLAHLAAVAGVADLSAIFERLGKYLFFSIGDRAWVVDTRLGAPGFFRTRFARLFGNPVRGNWKEMRV